LIVSLRTEEVLNIHEVLAADFAAADDPISPSGVRSMHLLESAVSRQFTGIGERLKYDNPVLNAAALSYGLCNNHPFYNGNKRTSLVTLLCHLDKNELMFREDVGHDELYGFMLKIADHSFSRTSNKGDKADAEVQEIAHWVRKRVRKIERGERIVTFRELKGILSSHGFVLENFDNNRCDVVRYTQRSTFFGFGKPKLERSRMMRMGYPGDGENVGKGLLRDLRDRCGLSERDGVDSHSFYTKVRPADFFVTKYRGTLKRLARV